MKLRKMGKILPALCIALLFALIAAGCGPAETPKTMLELNQEYSALTVFESSGGINMDITLSDTVNDMVGGELQPILDLFKQMTYSSKSDAVNMSADATVLSGGNELFHVVMDGPGEAYYMDMTGLIDAMKNIDASGAPSGFDFFPEELEADLQGNQWVKINFPDSSVYVAARELIADYMLGLDNEVFTNFDSGFVKAISGGYEFKVTYEQLGPYIQALGTYVLENLDAFVSYTKTFLQGLTEEQLDSIGLTADMRDEAIAGLDDLAAPENKALYESSLASAVSTIQMPDIASILGGSYIDLKLTKSGETFTWAYDFLINLNFEGSSLGALFGVDFGNNAIRITVDEQTKPIDSFTPEIPTSSIIDAEDTEYFAGVDLGLGSAFDPYAFGY
ncbi:MAG: hypothetical protein LBK56_09135 [Gracilibacteraceae bacterium]|jgi:hypothetical protein|nr:hypothetical protein [Gracilibacteraceae bacterium]